ncbi:lactonase family protein [Epilithonimonas tenax]|uniref:lactonase family protein n=1 Tax=Epilithonimonas tenax TaxID=191577 RepID=UPI000481C920|nr:lactonase family protein [Epilithonimonas tenax]
MKIWSAFIFSILFMTHSSAQNTIIVGTYTNSDKCKSGGIHIFDFDENTYKYNLKFHTDNIVNPSFISLSPDKNFLFSVNENGENSTVTSFSMDEADGRLIKKDERKTQGEDPCFLISDDQNVITANYSGGSINVFKRYADGKLSDVFQNIKFEGVGVNPKRQEKSHIHQVQFSPDHQYVLATDLGLDQIYVFKYHKTGDLVLEKIGAYAAKKGSGPRHIEFDKTGKLIYLVQELSGDLSVLGFNEGHIELIQEETLLSRKVRFNFRAADIHLSNNERFVYVTNRDDADDITVFKRKKNGTVKKIQQTKTIGRNPRNFTISPNNKLVLIANQDTNRINIFTRDLKNGFLTTTGKSIPVCSPVNVLFYEKGK